MSGKLINKKILIPAIVGMIAVIVVLVVLIIHFNSDNDEKDMTATGALTENPTSDITPTESVKTDTKTTDSLEPTPTASGSEDSRKKEEVKAEPVTVTLGQYKGLTSKYEPETITDETIEKTFESMKAEFTEIKDMPDRAFEDGDMAIVTFEGDVDGNVIDQLSGVCLQVVIGNGIMPEVIEKDIIGRHIGDTFYQDIDYPADYENLPDVAGKTVHFTLELVDGFTFAVPEINDEFIAKVTDYKTVSEYKTKEKEKLQEEANEKAHEEMLEDLKNQVVNGSTFSGSIDNEIKKSYVLRLQAENEYCTENYFMEASTYYFMAYGMSPEEFQKQLMSDVTLEVKYGYVLDEIVKTENLVSREEAEQLIIDSALSS